MNEDDRDDMQRALRYAFPPVNAELKRDLWPAMLRKIYEPRATIAWFDWALAGVAGGLVAVFPDLLLVLVYHL
jgi:hypothetical protein